MQPPLLFLSFCSRVCLVPFSCSFFRFSYCVVLLVQHSSAYWLAKAENASLQRVYGISFPNKDKLKEWKAFMKMAEERDHRKIGQQQELFFFHKWSPGSAFFLPHGTRVYNKLMQLIKN